MRSDRSVPTLNVLLCGNSSTQAVFPALIKSIARNTNRVVHVKVLCDGWIAEPIYTPSLTVEFSESISIFAQKSKFDVVTARLRYLEFLEDWDRCILFDWDQLVLKPFDDYYDHQFSGRGVITGCANRATLIRKWRRARGRWKQLPISVTRSEGFSCGSNIVDLDRYREMAFDLKLNWILPLTRNHDHLSLCLLFVGHADFVSREFNSLHGKSRKSVPDPTIIHFAGPRKPWLEESSFSHHYLCNWGEFSS